MKMMGASMAALGCFVMGGIGMVSCAQKTAVDPAAQEKVMQATRAQDEADIRAIDVAWAKAAGSKNVDQATSVYAENGTLLAPGAPIASGKDAIRKTWTGLMGSPGFALQFTPTKIEISKSGDSAYEIGDYQLTVNGKNGKPETVKAKYVVVWGKQTDGSWKALVDAPTTTQ